MHRRICKRRRFSLRRGPQKWILCGLRSNSLMRSAHQRRDQSQTTSTACKEYANEVAPSAGMALLLLPMASSLPSQSFWPVAISTRFGHSLFFFVFRALFSLKSLLIEAPSFLSLNRDYRRYRSRFKTSDIFFFWFFFFIKEKQD